ncbi:MAG TPA: CYTH domain-containing protein [Spirochaetota bacterium]|nr:CYTH domain-containing protein [Spirochaetota bacterium]HOS32156.1 CYTH domain-containing protein [Spirochaetota bacterium]HOS55465.1 CYTH domain-containing protein [Spirochaetota bacterium]HPK62292.1 CYTH domain-containing protein [Spirochaetota bacterium]HQF78054.1 CYTH domain-containing protein [Spirochaetota bacterium]
MLEIEKKYFVGNFDDTLKLLQKRFEKYDTYVKSGFWWRSNCSGLENILDLGEPKLLKKEASIIKEIGEFVFPAQDYDFLRIRIINGVKYSVTFKNKALVKNIERNTEYEFEIEKELLLRIIDFLKENCFIFYYNIKESKVFNKKDISIELSTFNDLVSPYLEIEALGDNERELFSKIEQTISQLNLTSLKEEPKNYVELSFMENKNRLKNVKLSTYSREAFKELQNKLSGNG